jgi:CelD/BcsL family acetyltransferase involved in cellulose biosynthesis
LICANLHISDVASSFTQIVDLERELTDLKSVWQSSGVNYDRRIAHRKGVRIERTGPKDLDTFFSVYSTLKHTWENVSTEYKKSFFEKLISSNQADFWAIYVNDMYVGGGILVKGVNHVSSWLTIIHPDYTTFRPYEFFYTTVIEYYRELGFKWFDFNPSAGLPGVVRFKDKFGCDHVPFFTLKSRTVCIQFLDYVRGWNV